MSLELRSLRIQGSFTVEEWQAIERFLLDFNRPDRPVTVEVYSPHPGEAEMLQQALANHD